MWRRFAPCFSPHVEMWRRFAPCFSPHVEMWRRFAPCFSPHVEMWRRFAPCFLATLECNALDPCSPPRGVLSFYKNNHGIAAKSSKQAAL